MKNLFFLLFVIFPTCIFCQIPPKKSTKIIVVVNDSSNTILNKIALALFDRGYTIETKDEKLKLLTTKELPSKHYGTISKMRVRINDTAAVFSSLIALNMDRDLFGIKRPALNYIDVDFSGAKKSANREAWNEMLEIAKSIGNTIVYSK